MSEELLTKLSFKSKDVEDALKMFKEEYKNSVEENFITNIITGEAISIKPENVSIDDKCSFVDKVFDARLTYCTKKLYSYQKKAILKLREIELMGKVECKHTGETIITNACVLSLPIGAGKSLCYEFIAMFYRQVPLHPIILSTDMRDVPEHFPDPIKTYPKYCEKPAYIEGEPNAVQVLEGYRQRNITLILTHEHLIEQMKYYFETDFKKAILKSVNIQYCRSARDCEFDKDGIIVVAVSDTNVDILVQASYEAPFMRVIADDMTDFPLDKMRQILASFTIFVSGSGWQRNPKDISDSYYSLKHVPYQKISVVGKPEETYEGVMRNNIAMVKLLGTRNPFSQYAFVSDIEKVTEGMFNCKPSECYAPIAKDKRLSNWITLGFILRNLDVIKVSISRIEQDLKAGVLNKSKVEYYLQWKEMLLSSASKDKNPLYEFLYKRPQDNMINNKVGSIVNENCLCCNKDSRENSNYGALSMCCGAFYCSECLKSMITHKMLFADGTEYIDNDNYYCCSCREKNCKFILNSTKIRDRNIYAFSLVDDFFKEGEDGTLKGHYKVDYYFYMFIKGLTPSYAEGKPLRITKHDGFTTYDILSPPPTIERIYPADHLAIHSIYTINDILGKRKICPRRGTNILFFAAPEYMINRVYNVKKTIAKAVAKETEVEYAGKKIQPIENLEFLFRDSVANLIGLHSNILAIIVWNKQYVIGEEEIQMLGRIYRLNGFNNPLYFYIENSVLEYS